MKDPHERLTPGERASWGLSVVKYWHSEARRHIIPGILVLFPYVLVYLVPFIYKNINLLYGLYSLFAVPILTFLLILQAFLGLGICLLLAIALNTEFEPLGTTSLKLLAIFTPSTWIHFSDSTLPLWGTAGLFLFLTWWLMPVRWFEVILLSAGWTLLYVLVA